MWGGGRGLKRKVAENVLKHALILEFLKSEKKLFQQGFLKKSCSCSHFGIFKIQKINCSGGWGVPPKSYSKCAERCSCF